MGVEIRARRWRGVEVVIAATIPLGGQGLALCAGDHLSAVLEVEAAVVVTHHVVELIAVTGVG